MISLFVFRSLIAAALPLLVGAITIPLTMAMVSVYNEITSLSVFALNLTTGLGLGSCDRLLVAHDHEIPGGARRRR